AGSLAPGPFVGAAVWAPTLLAAAGARDALEAVVEGRLRFAPVLRRDLTGLARRGEDGVAFDAQGAAVGLLLGPDDELCAVALGAPTRSVDLTRTLCSVGAGAPSITVDAPLGTSLTTEVLRRTEAVALAVLAADLLGVMQRSLDEAVVHVSRREQFGLPVGSFQAVQHLAAHAATFVEGARSSMWHAAWAADERPAADALLAARQAKAYCSAAAREVGETAIQMFGGIGLTWEHLAHVRQRRALLSRRVLGDEAAQYAAIGIERLALAGKN
nr:acyl-CoA dehydrogenase family protein [Micromonospora sp. DSM 115978]